MASRNMMAYFVKTAVLLLLLCISFCHAVGPLKKRQERAANAAAERQKYIELRKQGHDEVSNTVEAKALRDYRLACQEAQGIVEKTQGLSWLPSSFLESLRKNTCAAKTWSCTPISSSPKRLRFRLSFMTCPRVLLLLSKTKRVRKNLGFSVFRDTTLKPAPFTLRVGKNHGMHSSLHGEHGWQEATVDAKACGTTVSCSAFTRSAACSHEKQGTQLRCSWISRGLQGASLVHGSQE